tara:strand:+ start:20 stop:1387 length:1368 start_codon:yes stop_codon:yes gene_type:complete
MIKPAISPRTITGSATAGIISAARSGVRNIKDITETISNEPEVTKEEKFGINYVGFFGSRRVNKDLKKSMKTIKDSVGSTFGIAKALKESVTKGAGVFGFVGKLIGGAAAALPIFTLLGIPLLKGILGIVAVGGIGALLSTFGGDIISFVKDKASGFSQFVRDVVGDFFLDRRTSQEFQSIKERSEARIEETIESDINDDRQQAVIDANQNEIKLLQAEKLEYEKNNKDDRNYRETLKAYDDRIKQLQTGKLDLVEKGFFRGLLDFPGKLASAVVESEAPTVASFGKKSYQELNPEQKLDTIRELLGTVADRGDIDKARLLYEQEIQKGDKLSDDQLIQANDVLRYLETFGDDPLGKLEKDEKEEFLKKLIPTSSSIKAKELSKKIPKDVSSVSGVTQSGNAGNVAVLPMGKNSNETLVRNDTGGLSSGPSMKLHPNFDIDNFVAPINMASFNIV